MENPNIQLQKQTYHTPQFRMYGNIGSLTAAAGNKSNTSDNGKGQDKTA